MTSMVEYYFRFAVGSLAVGWFHCLCIDFDSYDQQNSRMEMCVSNLMEETHFMTEERCCRVQSFNSTNFLIFLCSCIRLLVDFIWFTSFTFPSSRCCQDESQEVEFIDPFINYEKFKKTQTFQLAVIVFAFTISRFAYTHKLFAQICSVVLKS